MSVFNSSVKGFVHAAQAVHAYLADAARTMQPWAAIIIGFSSGVVYVGASKLMSNVFKIDDPLDAVAVHGFCGAWGLICAAAFSHTPNYIAAYGGDTSDAYGNDRVVGFFYGGDGRLLACAIVLILAITGWVLGHMVPFFFLMRMAGLLRVDEAEERAGLDVSHHGGAAYEAAGATELAIAGGHKDGGKGSKESDALLSRCGLLRFTSACGDYGCSRHCRCMHLVRFLCVSCVHAE